LVKRPLATHLRSVHGVGGIGFQVVNQTNSRIASRPAPTERSYITSAHRAPEVAHRGRGTTTPSENHVFDGSGAAGIHDLLNGRFYCQEYDCGRGFSSEEHLHSHVRFFHPKKRAQTKEGGEDATAFSTDIPEVTAKPSEHPPAYFSSTSTIGSPSARECTVQESPSLPSPAPSPVPTPVLEGHQVTYSDAGMGIQSTFGSPVGSPVAADQDEVNAPPAAITSTSFPSDVNVGCGMHLRLLLRARWSRFVATFSAPSASRR